MDIEESDDILGYAEIVELSIFVGSLTNSKKLSDNF